MPQPLVKMHGTSQRVKDPEKSYTQESGFDVLNPVFQEHKRPQISLSSPPAPTEPSISGTSVPQSTVQIAPELLDHTCLLQITERPG